MDDEAVPSGPDVEDNATLGKEEGHECEDVFDVRKFDEAVQAYVTVLIMTTRIIRTLAFNSAPFDDALKFITSLSEQLESMDPGLRGAVFMELVMRGDDWEPTPAVKDGQP